MLNIVENFNKIIKESSNDKSLEEYAKKSIENFDNDVKFSKKYADVDFDNIERKEGTIKGVDVNIDGLINQKFPNLYDENEPFFFILNLDVDVESNDDGFEILSINKAEVVVERDEVDVYKYIKGKNEEKIIEIVEDAMNKKSWQRNLKTV